MTKKKPAAQIFVADQAGRMIPVHDWRFDDEPWPCVFNVPAARADVWMEYLQTECEARGWQWASIGQMDSEENSGSITIRTQDGPEAPQAIVVWERQRVGPLVVRAKPAGQPALSSDETAAFIRVVNEHFDAGITNRVYQRAYLCYDGLPWRGELWLNDDLRLGPPSRHAEWLSAPQIIVVDSVVHAVGWRGARAQLDTIVKDLEAFLSVIMHCNLGVPHGQQVWTTAFGETVPQIRQRGYFEESVPNDMPPRGQSPLVPVRPVSRPDFGHHGITTDDNEQWLPADIHDLWSQYNELYDEKRQQFQRVGSLYKLACGLWADSATTSLALLVVACEALKPQGKRYKNVNVYGVVEALLGGEHAQRLEALRHPPQRTRSKHLHEAALFASELAPWLMLSTFKDPSFRGDYGTVKQVVTASLVEWLRRRGNFRPIPRKRGKRLIGRVRDAIERTRTRWKGLLGTGSLGRLVRGLRIG